MGIKNCIFFCIVQLWVEVGKHWERKAEYNVLVLFLATCIWSLSFSHSAVHCNSTVLSKVLVWSSLLRLCLLIPSTDFENSFSPHQPLLLLWPTCKFKSSAAITFHNLHSSVKGCSGQAPLHCCRMPSGFLHRGKLQSLLPSLLLPLQAL